MKKFAEDVLLEFVRGRIRQGFATPEQVLQVFRANIRSKLKTIHAPKVLTEPELEKHSANVTKAVFEDLGRISGEAIRYRMCSEIIDKSLQRGFNPEEHTAYFDGFAKELVRALLQSKFKEIAKKRNQVRKQKQVKNETEEWNAVT